MLREGGGGSLMSVHAMRGGGSLMSVHARRGGGITDVCSCKERGGDH